MKTCIHLAPLEEELARENIPLGESRTSPYGAQWGEWCGCDCVFDADALRKRLGLPDCVDYTEYDGRVARQRRHIFLQGMQARHHGLPPALRRPADRQPVVTAFLISPSAESASGRRPSRPCHPHP